MRRKCTPEFAESLDATLVASHPEFELIARMDIDDDGQSRRQDHIERTVDVAQIGGIKNRRIGRVRKQRRGLDREAHVIEPHRFNERDVLCRGMSIEMRLRVIGGLREPVTKIDPAPQTCKSRCKIYGFFVCLRRNI